MRILAIRGKNLTSLSASFCIDFQQEPLASAGLFAITGPTGSGKSTLLDALCLALYDDTPRLSQSREGQVPDVGAESVGQKDPRTLLRRGAAEGYAEVDFLANDGKAYRARWSVRRARNKADGKLQATDISLVSLPDLSVLSDHKKTETLSKIESLIGLTFQQFNRAVLLAQNDFASFLKANDNDRAQLLETLTGTDTFTRISILAFDRAKHERDQLAQLQSLLQGQIPLSPDARKAKEDERQSLSSTAASLQEQKKKVEDNLRWYRDLDKIKNEQTTAQANLQTAQARQNASVERARHLSTIDSVQSARALVAESDRLYDVITRGKHDLEKLQRHLHAATLRTSRVEKEVASYTEQLSAAEVAYKDAQPRIDEAKKLEAQISALTPDLNRATQAHENAAVQLNNERARMDRTTKDTQAKSMALASARDWLRANDSYRGLATHWPRWETLLSQLNRQRVDELESEKSLNHLVDLLARQNQALNTAKAAHRHWVKESEAVQSSLRSNLELLKKFDLEASALQRKTLDLRREHVSSGQQIWEKLEQHKARSTELREQRRVHLENEKHAQAALDRSRDQLSRLEADLKSATEALESAHQAANENVLHLRATLVPNAPCPVCGSHDHPFADLAPRTDSELAQLKDNLLAVQNKKNDVYVDVRVNEERKLMAVDAIKGVDKDLAAIEKAKLSLEPTWKNHPLIREFSDLPGSHLPKWFAEQKDNLQRQLSLLDQGEAEGRKVQRQRDELQAKLEELSKARDRAQNDLLELEKSLSLNEQKADAERKTLASNSEKRAQTQVELDSALPDPSWRGDWESGPEAFVDGLRKTIELWNRKNDEALQLANEISQLDTALSAQSEACDQASKTLAKELENLNSLRSRLEHFQTERNALFAENSLAAVESGYIRTIDRQKASLTAAKTELDQAREDLARMNEGQKNAAQSLEMNGSNLDRVQKEINNWLNLFNAAGAPNRLMEDELRELLKIEPRWIAQERKALDEIHHQVATMQGILKNCTQRLADHESSRGSQETRESLQDSLLSIEQNWTLTSDRLTLLNADLLNDDQCRQKSQDLQVKVEAQRAKSVLWDRLNDLIGSADGKKFRNFAQQITLDILLSYANRHLEVLSRRYRLERIQDNLGLMVVDQDMGDEVRSVVSLSGGETFLVSMALALGLASLSSHRVRVDSLFIDEGFGSLDADSLSIAMEALDNLQAQGRKVGVISHVQEMNERISTRIQLRRQTGGESSIEIVG